MVVGADGWGSRGRGRIAISHGRILETLQGFFTVIKVDEYNTSKKCPTCRGDTDFPREWDTRSKRCKERECPRHRGYDRDDGAGYLFIVNFCYQLLNGAERMPELRRPRDTIATEDGSPDGAADDFFFSSGKKKKKPPRGTGHKLTEVTTPV